MASETVSFACAACGLAIVADESPDGTEADGSFVRVFWCANESKHLLLDAEAPEFRGHCPTCGGAVALLRFPLEVCPKCLAPAKSRRAYRGPL